MSKSNTSPLNQNSIASKTPIDFTFCDIPKRNFHQEHHETENPFGFSPPIWASKNVLSSYATIMAEGRKELMELMPESCNYELSLKDIVVKDSDNSKLVMEERIDTKKGKKKGTKKGKKKGTKKHPISRSVSLDTGVYILKMFVPSSLGSKKHKVSRSKSMGGLRKDTVDVEKRKAWLFVGNKFSSGLGNHNSSCASDKKNRYGDGMFKPNGCLFRSKPTNQRGCVFF